MGWGGGGDRFCIRLVRYLSFAHCCIFRNSFPSFWIVCIIALPQCIEIVLSKWWFILLEVDCNRPQIHRQSVFVPIPEFGWAWMESCEIATACKLIYIWCIYNGVNGDQNLIVNTSGGNIQITIMATSFVSDSFPTLWWIKRSFS